MKNENWRAGSRVSGTYGALYEIWEDDKILCKVRKQKHAHLIAIAPEMLETLEEISCQFSADIKEGKITATVTLNPTKIRSLIAKATGDK